MAGFASCLLASLLTASLSISASSVALNNNEVSAVMRKGPNDFKEPNPGMSEVDTSQMVQEDGFPSFSPPSFRPPSFSPRSFSPPSFSPPSKISCSDYTCPAGYVKKCSYKHAFGGNRYVGSVTSNIECYPSECNNKCCLFTDTIIAGGTNAKAECRNLCRCAQETCRTDCPYDCDSKTDNKGAEYCNAPTRKKHCSSGHWWSQRQQKRNCARTCCQQKLCSDGCRNAVKARCEASESIIANCKTYYQVKHCSYCSISSWYYRLTQTASAVNQTASSEVASLDETLTDKRSC